MNIKVLNLAINATHLENIGSYIFKGFIKFVSLWLTEMESLVFENHIDVCCLKVTLCLFLSQLMHMSDTN